MKKQGFVLAVGALVFFGPGSFADDWRQFIGAYRHSYREANPLRLNVARTALAFHLQLVDDMFSRSESEKYWREKFSWPELSALSKAVTPDSVKVDMIYRGLFFQQKGMEYPQIEALRAALREFRDAAYFHSLANGEFVFIEKLNQLVGLVERYEEKQLARDRIDLGATLHWFESSRLVPTMVQQIKPRYWQPNSVGQFNINILEKYALKPVNQTKSGEYSILGNPTSSTSTVTGTTYLRFLPSERSAEIEVGMNGHMSGTSRSTGGERGVAVSVTGPVSNTVNVQKRVSLRGMAKDQIVSHAPSATVTPNIPPSDPVITVSAQPFMPRLPPRLQVIRNVKERVGLNTTLEKMPKGQAEGRRIAAAELVEAAKQPVELPAEVTQVAAQFEGLAKEFIISVQQQTGVAPKQQWLASDPTWIFAKQVRGNEEELAASTRPPEFLSKAIQVGVRVHESEIANTANRQAAGHSLSDAELEYFARSVLNYVPPLLRLGTHAPNWSLMLASPAPVVVDFEDQNRISLLLRLQSFSKDEYLGEAAEIVSQPFAVHVVYEIKLEKGNAMLKRVSEAELVDLRGEAAVRNKLLNNFLLPRLRALFKEEIFFDGLTPVRGGIFEPLTKLEIKELRTTQDWLMLGADLKGDLLDIIKATPSGLGGDERVIPIKPK